MSESENKIIGLDGAPLADKPQEEQKQAEARPQLTPQNFAKIAGAFERLEELSKAVVATPTASAEITGLRKFLTESFLVFGPELLGCWEAVRHEYEPMLKAVAQVTQRVGSILAGVRAQRLAQAKAAAAEQKESK